MPEFFLNACNAESLCTFSGNHTNLEMKFTKVYVISHPCQQRPTETCEYRLYNKFYIILLVVGDFSNSGIKTVSYFLYTCVCQINI